MRYQYNKSLLNSHDPSLQWSIDLEYHHNQHHDSSREGSVGLMVGMPTWELRRWRQAWVGRQNLSTYDLLVMWGDEEDGDDDGDDGDGDGGNQWNMMITKNFQCIYHLLCLNNFLNFTFGPHSNILGQRNLEYKGTMPSSRLWYICRGHPG